jgi:hypothetical protein
MHWVLMVILLGPNSGRATVSMQEFNTKPACENAAQLIRANATDARDIKAIQCIPKGV